MIAYQIVIPGDKRSEEYARISRESFDPLIAAGYISEIRQYDAVTPEREDFEEHVNKYHWAKSLMKGDLVSGKNRDDHSPTEKAGMCSHWDLLRIASESDERILVLEHDSYLLPEHFDTFIDLLDKIEEHDVYYANIGLFMGCYTLKPHTAGWMYEVLTEGSQFNMRFPINCGPYCVLQRLFRTYTTHYLKPNNYDGISDEQCTVIHPWHHCDTLYMGRRVDIPFNQYDPDKENNRWHTPTTQVISKKLCVTQDHWGYRDEYQEEPWKRHPYFAVID